METEYDEDVCENSFFQALRRKYKSVGENMTRHGWVVCVPRRGSFVGNKSLILSDEQLCTHILIPQNSLHPSNEFCTLNGHPVEFIDGAVVLKPQDLDIFSSRLLFEETFYEEGLSKYRVWCIEHPLPTGLRLRETIKSYADTAMIDGSGRNNFPMVVTNLREASIFLWEHTMDKRFLKEFVSLVEKFGDDRPNFEEISISAQRDSLKELYETCVMLLLQGQVPEELRFNDKHFMKNFELSVETYILYTLRGMLRKSLSARTADADAKFNKILSSMRNASEVESESLEYERIRGDIYERVHPALRKLSELQRFATVLEKTECLKKSVRCLCQGLPSVSSDDLLPALALLVVRANIPNWIEQLNFLKYFRFSVPLLRGADEASFLITSLEAAIEYLRSDRRILFTFENQAELRQVNRCPRYRCSHRTWQRRGRGEGEGEGNERSPINRLFASIEAEDMSDLEEILPIGESHGLGQIPMGDRTLALSRLCHPLCICENCERNRAYYDLWTEATVRSRNEKGIGALHVAALYDRETVIRFLLSRDQAAVDLADEDGRTALHWASRKGHCTAIRALLEANGNPEAVDSRGNTPLHLAVEHGHEDCVEMLLGLRLTDDKAQGVEHTNANLSLDPSPVNFEGDTPLHRASKWGYREVVQILMAYGANPAVKNKRGETAVTLALNRRISDLLARGNNPIGVASSLPLITDMSQDSDFSIKYLDSRLSLKPIPGGRKDFESERNMERLLAAITEGDTHLACYYLGLPNQRENVAGPMRGRCHPLCDCEHCSVNEDKTINSDWQVGRTWTRVMKNERLLNVNSRNRGGETALHVASAVGSTKMVRILLDVGADVNARTDYELRTPLHLACLCDKINVLQLLANCATCDLDAKDRNGDSPLHLAVKTANAKLVRVLVRYGAKTNIRNSRGLTPLKQLQEQILRDDDSLSLVDISNILKRNSFETLPPVTSSYWSSSI